MKGIPLHPLRIRALDRMSVLRVPMKWLPDPDCVWCKGHGYEWIDADPSGFDYRRPCRCIKPPYAPGDYFVAESWMLYHTINSVVRSDGRSYEEVSDGLAAYKADGYGTVNDFIEHARLVSGADFRGIEVKKTRWLPSNTMPEWAARHILTLGPPVPCRLGDVTEEKAKNEGAPWLLVPLSDEGPMPEGIGFHGYRMGYSKMWNQIYPRHPYSPDLWTWGYPVERRGR